MDVLFFLNGASFAAVAGLSFYSFYSLYSRGSAEFKMSRALAVMGIFYFLMGVINFLWAFGILAPSGFDFALMNLVLSVVTSVIIIYISYKIAAKKNLIYLLFLFMAAIFAVNFRIKSFFIFSMAISSLLLVIAFVDLAFYSNYHLRRAGFFGLFYAGMLMLYIALSYTLFESFRLLWLLPNIAMFLVVRSFYLDVSNLGIHSLDLKIRKSSSTLHLVTLFFRFAIFLVSVMGFMVLSTIALHEFGHAIAAQYYGCEHTKAVIYDVLGSPHTEIICSSYYNDMVITLGGLMATFVVGAVFLIAGSEFTTLLSIIIFGLSLLISYGDLSELGISGNILAALMILSLIVISFGIIRLSVYHLRHDLLMGKPLNKGLQDAYHGLHSVKKIVKDEYLAFEKDGKNA